MARSKAHSKGRGGRRRTPRTSPARKRVSLDEIVEVESLAAGGDGVARLEDGRVLFVRLASPGDRVRILEAETGGSFLRATSFERVADGPSRREPACPSFGRCGGCAWQHVEPEAQRAARKQILFDAVSRIAKLDAIPKIDFVASPEEYGYRGRTRLLVLGGTVGFRRHQSHAIEPITHCPVLCSELDRALGALAARLDGGALRMGTGEPVEFELARSSDGTVVETRLDANASSDARVQLEVSGELLQVSAGGFAQANPLLFDAMFERVAAALPGGARLLELYAGSGFFTLGLARHYESVLAIESNPVACRDLAVNLERAGLDHVEIRCTRVEEELEALANEAPGAVLLDPPRAGLPRGAAAQIVALGAQRIAYMSCDPATLARDLAVFCADAGAYRLTSLTAFDVFPQTPHVEALAVLERTGSNVPGR